MAGYFSLMDPASQQALLNSGSQPSSSSASTQYSMPLQEQQIYNYLNPTGTDANLAAGTYNPNQTINTNYTGQIQQNPLQPNYLNAPVQGQATTFAGAQIGQGVNPYLLNQFSGQSTLGQLNQSLGGNLAGQVGPQAAEQQLYNAFQPAQATATRSLNDTLAAMGLSGGPAIQAQDQLQSQLGAGLGQSLAGLISGGQSNLLNLYGQNAGILNQGNQNQIGLLNNQAGLNQQTGLANQNAMNAMTGQNLSNLYNTNQYNATAANDANSAYANALLGAYNQNLSNIQGMNTSNYANATNLAGQAMGGSQSLANQQASAYPVYSGIGSAFGNLGSSLGQNSANSSNGYNATQYNPYSGGVVDNNAGAASGVGL